MRSTNAVRSTTLVRRDERVLHARVEDGLAMMSIERGFYFGVNAVGRRIWEWLAEERSVGQLCDRLQAEFEVDRATCEREVLGFIEDLARERLVQVRNAPA